MLGFQDGSTLFQISSAKLQVYFVAQIICALSKRNCSALTIY